MKKVIYILIFTFCAIAFSACSTSQKVTVKGTPGTEIYSPRMKKLGTIGPNAQVSFKISSDDYFAFLMSKNAESDELIPFALDYKEHKHRGAYIGLGIAIATTSVGVAMTIPGLIGLAVGDETLGGPVLGAGLAIGGLGAALGAPMDCRTKQIQYQHHYKYLSYQTTNQDFRFVPITDTGYRKTIDNANAAEEVVTAYSTETNENAPSSTVARRRSTPVASSNITDNTKFLSGTYTGTGYLAQKGKTIEKYSNMKVVVLRIDKDNVSVDVTESGESYFSTKSKYSVKKKGKNTYILTLIGIPYASITIDAKGHLSYKHPKVNIDGEIYTLNITADKK